MSGAVLDALGTYRFYLEMIPTLEEINSEPGLTTADQILLACGERLLSRALISLS